MPNKTLYVREADLPLFDRAQEQLGDSVSAMFAEFLRNRVAMVTPEEGRIIQLIEQINKTRDAIRNERSLPEFLEYELTAAEEYAEKALKSFRRGEVCKTKVYFYAANTYREKADRDVKEARELGEKLAGMLKGC